MDPGFRVRTGLTRNLKFRDLARRIGDNSQALWLLYRLWEFTASFRPNGDLTGIEPEEIGLTREEWDHLIQARGYSSDTGFLAINGNTVKVHQWEQTQRAGLGAPGSAAAGKRLARHRRKILAESEKKLEERAQKALAGLILTRSDTGKSHVSQFQGGDGKAKRGESTSPKSGGTTGGRAGESRTEKLGSPPRVSPPPFPPPSYPPPISPPFPPPSTTPSLVMISSPSESGHSAEAKADDGAPVLELRPVPGNPKKPVKKSPLIEAQLEAWLERSFLWFYGLYPRHDAKESARRAWKNLHRDLLAHGKMGITREVREAIVKDIRERINSGEWDPSNKERAHYIPLPATYLNGRRWDKDAE